MTVRTRNTIAYHTPAVRRAADIDTSRRREAIAQYEFTWNARAVFAAATVAFALLFPGCAALRPTDPYKGPSITIRTPASPAATDQEGALPSLSTTPEEQFLDEPLNLDRCIAVALRNNPGVAAAQWDSEAAAAEKHIQAGKRLPNVRLTGSYFHYQDPQRLVPPSSPGEATYFAEDVVTADLILRLPLYTGGRIVNEVRAADLLARSAEHVLNRTREGLVFNVTSVYFAILAQRHIIESLEFSQGTLEEHVARVQNLIDAQKAAKVDRLRTEVRLADLQQRLIQERNVLAVQLRLLSNLMGLAEDDASALKIAGDLAMPEVEAMDLNVVRALSQREDYAAAAAALEAQARRVDIARGAREPQVVLEASYGGRWGIGGSGDPAASGSRAIAVDAQGKPTYSVTSPYHGGASLISTYGAAGLNSLRFSRNTVDAADSFEDVGRVGVIVDIPLFEGGSLNAQIAKERAKLYTAQQRLRKLELQIRLEVETAVLNIESARRRVAVTQKSIAEAEESLRIEREKYNFGKGAIVDVLDAQAALLNAQTTLYRALSDMNVARAQLDLAMGELKK